MRKLSPYEKTHLARFGKTNISLEEMGESPVEYITGKVEFMDRVFEVNKHVLIPRIETEQLVKMAVDFALKTSKKTLIIFDVGAGSGAIGISFFLELLAVNPSLAKTTKIFLSDVSDEIIDITSRNLKLVDQKYHPNFKIIKSDLLDQYPKVRADLVLANLPYIPTGRIAHLSESVKDFEPHIALDGGDSGLVLIKKLFANLPEYLNPNATILLEVDHTHLVEELDLKPQNWKTKNIIDEFLRQRFFEVTFVVSS